MNALKMLAALIVALILFAVLAVPDHDNKNQKDICKSMCSVERADVRMFEPGICICKAP